MDTVDYGELALNVGYKQIWFARKSVKMTDSGKETQDLGKIEAFRLCFMRAATIDDRS